ncbi:MAG: molybdate ABC transporter permease subunit [Planctomycetes bacterium]|nr:molybdate ABC transporter permease subunit [Planctomycetota bacterium]
MLWTTILLSLEVAFAATLFAFVPAVLTSFLLARKSFPGKPLVESILLAPMVVPPVVTGYLLLVLLGRNGVFGKPLYELTGFSLAFTFQAAVIASLIVSFPLFVRSAKLAIELVDRRLELAASTLGAGPVRVFLTITAPLALPGIVTGAVLTFARSLGEFGATITFAGSIEGETRTLSLAIFSAMQDPSKESETLWLAAISLTISLAAIFLSELLASRLRKRMTGF